MAFDFPATPALDEEYTSGSITYRWDGTIWAIIEAPDVGIFSADIPPADPAPNTLWFNSANAQLNLWYVDADSSQWVQVDGGGGTVNVTGAYLPLTGGTLSGSLMLPAVTPAAPEEAANKAYVDSIVAAQSLYQSAWQVASNSPDLTPSVVNALHNYSWVASTVDPLVP